MDERFAIKRPGHLFWRSNLTRADVMQRVECGRITREWLICPQGTVSHTVTIGQFIDDPAILKRRLQQDIDRETRRRTIAAAVEKPFLLKSGQYLIRLFALYLMIGTATVKIFFPHMLGAGLTPTALMVLIPMWSIGGLGILAYMLGSIQHRYRIYVTIKHVE